MTTRLCKTLCLSFLVLSVSLLSMPVLAQNSNAGIKGTVKDISGSIVQGADVELVNSGTEEHRTEHTNKEGYFDFAALSPGEYDVTVNAEGFGAWNGKLTLRVAQEANLSPTLRVATSQTKVDVIDVTPVIDRSDATISDVKEAARIETLPLQNRNFLNILNFTPGVVANSFAGQGAGYTRVNGIPGGSMAYLVDGQDASERVTNELQRTPQPIPTIQELKITTSNGDAQYGRPGVVEVVTKGGTNDFHGQLFELNQSKALQAKTLGQSAVPFLVHNEFGGNLGGPIRIPKIYNGKDKTFFFFDFEGIRDTRSSGSQDDYSLPLANWKKGDLHDFVDATGTPTIIYDPNTTVCTAGGACKRSAFPGNIIPDARINPIARKILSYFPDPNINVPYYVAPNYQQPNARAKNNSTLVTAKADQVIGLSRLSARYTYTKQELNKPFAFLNPDERFYGGHNGAISFTEVITPHIVNELRAGVQLFLVNTGPRPITPAITQVLGLPTYNGTIAWPGIQYSPQDYAFSDVDRNNPKISNNNTISVGDNLSWTRGKHDVRLGFSGSRYAIKTIEQGQPGGNYAFSGFFTALQDPKAAATGDNSQALAHTGTGLADLLLGQTDQFFYNQVPAFHTRQSDYAGYVQDNWKLTSRLILNLGLRYEYWTPFEDQNGRAANLDLKSASGNNPKVVIPGDGKSLDPAALAAFTAAGLQVETAAAAGVPSSLWNMSKNNVAPRVGIAFQPDSKTTLRGGYGFYFWAMPLIQYQQNTRHNVPFANAYTNVTDNNNNNSAELTFPNGPSSYSSQFAGARDLGQLFVPPGAPVAEGSNGWNVTPWDPNYKPQRVQQYNLTLEHELPAHIGARLSYVGNHSDRLPQYDPLNALIPQAFLPGLPGATRQQRSPYPHFSNAGGGGGLDEFRWIGYANSNSLQAEAKQQVNQDMLVQASFVWQRSLTTSEGQNNSFGGLDLQPMVLDPNATDAQRLRALYAHDSYLPQYTFSFNTHYVLPFGRGKAFLNHENGFVNRFVSGFNVSAFYYWRSGLYFSPYYSSAGQSAILAPGKTGVLPKAQRTRQHWFDSAVDELDSNNVNLPYSGQAYIRRTSQNAQLLGNISRNTLTGPGFNNMDATVSKITPITERINFHLEAQVFNIYNHVNMSLPANLPNGNTTGNITQQVGLPRTIQVQGKITF